MFGWSLILRCYEIFPNNNIFFHLKKVLSSCPLTSLSCTLKLPVTVGSHHLFGFASWNESNYSMGFGLMANTFCYYLRNIEHVPLISGSFKKSNRKTEPNLPKCLCAAIPRDVLKSSPQLPLRSRVPAPSTWGFSWALRGCSDLKPSVTVHRESHYHWAPVRFLEEEAATENSALKGARY